MRLLAYYTVFVVGMIIAIVALSTGRYVKFNLLNTILIILLQLPIIALAVLALRPPKEVDGEKKKRNLLDED